MDKSDNIYVSDLDNSPLFKFNKEGKLVKVIQQQDTQLGEFSYLGTIKVINEKWYVCDHGNNRVQTLDIS